MLCVLSSNAELCALNGVHKCKIVCFMWFYSCFMWFQHTGHVQVCNTIVLAVLDKKTRGLLVSTQVMNENRMLVK